MVKYIADLKASNIARERSDKVRPRARVGITHRALLYEAQGGECGGCGEEMGDDRTIDHVVPRALDGSNALKNLLLMHARCNNAKADRPPNAFEIDRNERKNRALT